jgi:death-on-curing protein
VPPPFLTLDEVLAIHAHQIARYGGALGLRDKGLLESALAMPAATLAGNYLHPSPAEQAAAYLYHLVRNHPFIDGNKRVGLACALVFLRLNRIRIEATDDDLVELVIGVAEGRQSKADVAVSLRRCSKPESRARRREAKP